jgi:hypothetical protein
MIVIRIELWPRGDKEKAQLLGEIEITNDGTGTVQIGNYNTKLYKWSKGRTKRGGIWKQGKVTGFPRLKLGPYDLLLRALLAVVGKRNARAIAESEV